MNSATKVGEIFTAAGQAFSRLGDLTMQLHGNSDTPTGKWTDDEVNMLHRSIVRFSDDLNKISLLIKNRTVSQIRQALKKKALEDAGIPAKQLPAKQAMSKPTKQPTSSTQKPKQIQTVHIQQILPVQTISTTTPHQPQSHHSQPLQTAPKQIIIHQTNPALTAKKHQTTPQIVHIQPQQLHQLQQLQTTTVTLQQFQQMQQQQKSIAAATTLVSLPSTILAKTAEQLKEHKQLPSTAKQSVVVASATVSGTVATSNNVATIVDTSGSSAGSVGVTAIPSTGLKCGPDVMMTLNRLNTQEHDEAEDVTECHLPSDVAKLDFAGEEVVG